MPVGHLLINNRSLETRLFTKNPKFTYFKSIYKKIANFSIEDINQYFINDYGFSKRSSCILHNNADLINIVYLVVTLPNIPNLNQYNLNGTAFKWVDYVGEKLIKSIEIEINNTIIQKLTGYYIHIYNRLHTHKGKNIDKLIGNIKELNEFSNYKKEYKLYIPIPFWFGESVGNSLPINKFDINKVKINIEIEKIENLLIYGPTYFITIKENNVTLKKYEYIYQTKTNAKGQFFYFDKNTKRLYYNLLSNNNFYNFENDYYENLLNIESSYFITNEKKDIYYTPINNFTKIENNFNIDYITLNDAYFQIRYIYLDQQEQQIIKSIKKIEYIIKQYKYLTFNNIDSIKNNFNINGENCVFNLIWISVLQNDIKNKQSFKFSNNIINSNLSINSFDIYSKRDNDFIRLVNNFYEYNIDKIYNINSYVFSNQIEKYQPSGSINLSKIEKCNLFIEFNKNVSIENKINLYIIISNYNILSIENNKINILF